MLPLEIVLPENVRPAPWRATYILRPDLKLLESSLQSKGMLYPLIVQKDTMHIIDGFARWVAWQNIGHEGPPHFPIEVMNLDETDSMILHVEMNRPRSNLVAKDLSNLVKRCIRSGKYDDERLRDQLKMTVDEFNILADGALVKRKKMKEHKYSNAWVPVETSGLGEKPQIERPKTPDA